MATISRLLITCQRAQRINFSFLVKKKKKKSRVAVPCKIHRRGICRVSGALPSVRVSDARLSGKSGVGCFYHRVIAREG